MKSEIRKLEAENKKLKERIAELEKKELSKTQDDIPLDQRIRESADYYVATDGKDDV
tara:strand:- start:144 stop:314 length:171 start_codon:yes stop_codon:yes gene_type:complete